MAKLVREDNEEWRLYPLQGRIPQGTRDCELGTLRPMEWEPRILEDCDHRGAFYSNSGVLKRLLVDEESGMVVVTKHLVRSGDFEGTRATSVAYYEPI